MGGGWLGGGWDSVDGALGRATVELCGVESDHGCMEGRRGGGVEGWRGGGVEWGRGGGVEE